jgi:hypothetical protein
MAQLGVVAPRAGEELPYPLAELVALGGSAGGGNGEALVVGHAAVPSPFAGS